MGNIEEQRKLIALQLKHAREVRKLTQAQLADKLSELGINMGPSTIAKIESGRRGLEIGEAIAFADVLNLRWNDLNIKPEKQGPSRAERLRHQARGMMDEYEAAIKRAAHAADTFIDIVAEMVSLEPPHNIDYDVAENVDGKIKTAVENLNSSALRFYEAQVLLDLMDEPEYDADTGIARDPLPVDFLGVMPLYLRLDDQPPQENFESEDNGSR